MSSELMDLAEAIAAEYPDRDSAMPVMIDKIRASKDLTEAAIHRAAYDALRSASNYIRSVIDKQENKEHIPRYTAESQARTQTAVRGYLNWHLSDGSRLGVAAWDIVEHDAAMYEGNAIGNAIRGKFLRIVLTRKKDGKKVGEVWSEKALNAAMKRARAEYEAEG